ncbi:MAG: transposase, partial [Planctomycetota bacterium]|nr:transposase [Planctomycetota bacterium]
MTTAYYLKEELRLLWDQTDRKTGCAYLESWMTRAEASGKEQMTKMGSSHTIIAVIRKLEERILAQDKRIEALERRLGMTSQNSSQP